MRKPVYSRIYKDCEDGDERAALASEEWDVAKAHLAENGLLTDLRLRIVDRLARERVEYEFLFPIVAKEGAVLKTDGGGEYFNYRFSALKKHAAEILKLEEALKIPVAKGVEDGGKEEAPKVAANEFLSARPN